MNPLLAIRVADQDHAVGIWGRTLIQIWRGPATGTASAEVNEIGRSLVAAGSFPATCLFIVERGSPPPGEETRKNFATFSRDIASRMGIAVVVSEGGGFRAALVRAVGVALTTLVPHSSYFKFVNDLDTAFRLIGPHLPPGVGGVEALTRATEEVRAKIGAAHVRM